MDMGRILEDSFKYPASNWKRVLIFGVIVLIYQFSLQFFMLYINASILVVLLIIPFIISYLLLEGYQLRAIGTSINGEMEPPKLNNWLKMLVDGFKLFIVGLVYGIIPGIILGVGFVLLFTVPSGLNLLGILILLLGLVILFIVSLIMVMAISNMAYYGKLEAAFKLGEIKERIRKLGWLNYILVLIIVVLLGALLSVGAAFVSFIPILGFVLACLIVYPYLYLFIARAYALIYLETLEDEPEEPLTEMKNFPGTETNPN
jgi:hypothetical protein